MSKAKPAQNATETPPDSPPVPPPAKKDPPPEASKDAPKKTPLDWAKAKGHFTPRDPSRPESRDIDLLSPAYSAADVIYGWSDQAYHFQSTPFLITEQDFDAAMKAAAAYPTVAPHEAALPERRKKRFENFKPIESKKDREAKRAQKAEEK